MKKLGVVITDGVGYRNFILSEFLTEATSRFEEVVIFSGLPAEIYGNLPENVRLLELPGFSESPLTWFFRKAKEVAHFTLHKKGNFGIRDNYNANKAQRFDARGLLTRFIYLWTAVFHSHSWIRFYDRLQRATFPATLIGELDRMLAEQKIQLLFFTHQRPPFIAPIAHAAKKTGIPIGAFIFSWDNLASKGRMAAEFDFFLVWSELMKEELGFFYDRTSDANVSVVGTPQFEPYVMSDYYMDRNSFMTFFGLDPHKKTLFYSCGDISTSKNDEHYIELIAQALLTGALPPVNFIVRTSPAESPKRFDAIREKYNFIVWNAPDWRLAREGHQEEWSQRYPLASDVRSLRALLQYSDVNVNVLSTMTLDFFLFGKPAICPVFGTGNNGLYNDRRFLQFKHLTHVVDSGAVDIVYNEKELIDAIRRNLEYPDERKLQRRSLLDLEIGRPLEGTSARIVDFLTTQMPDNQNSSIP